MEADLYAAVNRLNELSQPEPSEQVEVGAEQAEPVAEVEDQEVSETQEVEQTESETPEPTRYKVTVNGEEREVELEDLRKGYMMESDYRKKTSEVARQRDEINKRYSELDSKISDADDVIKLLSEDLENDQELKEYDPKAYYAKKEAIEAKKKRLDEMKSERSKRFAESRDEVRKAENERLSNAIPEWLDDKTFQADLKDMQKLWEPMFNKDELGQMVDHRFYVLSRKAALYDRLVNAKPESKKTDIKPKSAAPGTPKSNSERGLSDAKERLKKSGHMNDAVAAIARLRGN